MIRNIVTYPDKRINVISPDLRLFDDDLHSVIQDLKDTLEAHNVNALSAIQIAIPMSIIVIKEDDGNFLEIINPRIIGKSGSINSDEKTLYFPDKTYSVKRYEKIKLIYQNKEGVQKSLDASGERAILLQRKIDYLFGATLSDKLDEKEKKEFASTLHESCSTVFKRDYFISFIQKILFFIILANIASLFTSNKTLFTFITYGTIAVLALLVAYFFVAYYESKEQGSCSSCQIGNIIGTTAKYTIGTLILFAFSYFFKA